MIVVMVRIPVGSDQEADKVVERFRNRAGLVDKQPGFLGFELLKGEGECVSVTRWASREDLDRWMGSQAHTQAHANISMQTESGHREQPPSTGQMRPMGGNVTIYEVVIPGGGPS